MNIIKDKIDYSNVKYGRYTNSLINDKRISPLAFKLMCILMNCNPILYHPTIKSLGKQLNVNIWTVNRAVKELKRYGYLESHGDRHNTEWTIHPLTKS